MNEATQTQMFGRVKHAAPLGRLAAASSTARPTVDDWHAHLADCQRCADLVGDPADWHHGSTEPPARGWYDRLFTDGLFRHFWTGERWRSSEHGAAHWRQVGDYPVWRDAPAP